MKILLTVIIASFTWTMTQAQSFNFRKFTEEHGLPQNFIYSISQGGDRNLYCSTGDGICIFNGYNFTSVSNKKLAENFVTTHYIDSRGIVWMGHNQNGLSYLRNKVISSLNQRDLANYKVSQIIESPQGNLFVASSGAGIFVVDTALQIHALGPSPENVFSIALDASGTLLAATSEGLKLLTVSAKNFSSTERQAPLLEGKKVRQVLPAGNTGDLFWLLCDENEIYIIGRKDAAYVVLRQVENISSDSFISCIFSDRESNLWLGTFGNGLQKLTFTEDLPQASFTSTEFNSRNGFSSQHVQSIFQDNEGNMWFGTLADGLIQKPVERFSFYGATEGLMPGRINQVLIHRDYLWLGLDSGLGKYHPATKHFAFFNSRSRFVNDQVTGLAIDKKGRLWIGTANNGLFTLDTTNMKFEHFSGKHKLLKNNVNAVEAMGDKILVATSEGLYVHNTVTGHIETLTTNEGLLHNNIQSTMCDSRNRIWIASHGAPPYYISKGEIKSFKKIPGMNSFRINSYCEDINGRIWIATEGDGVYVYDMGAFKRYTKSEGLLSDYCNGLVCTFDNAVWVTHRSGLSEKKAGNQLFNHFTHQKGLVYSENSINAADKDDENIWFGTSQGLVNYKSGYNGTNEIRPEVQIHSVTFNDKKYLPGEDLDQEYGFYSVRFDYVAVLLGEPSAVVYNYRLLGVDTTWRSTTSRSFDFPKLGDGTYTVQIIACNKNSNVCGSAPVSLSFVIRQPIWKHVWFYVLLVIGVVALTYTVIILRTRALKRTQLLLQLKVKQKTFLLQREKEAVETIKIELENKNKDITDSINYAKRIQDSILPPEDLLIELFGENHFVLFKPKDIVSGDFFWASRLNENGNGKPSLLLAAVIDCTGHGVPGAFLSIMANDFLKQSIVDPEVNMPNHVLDFLNENVSSHLNQSSSKNKMRDGMDIALVAIDQEKRKLYFSGANNPIYIFRKVKNEIDQIILTATKQAIGLVSEDTVKYAFREFNLLPGDIIYLFSDGYADQFGGENNKKFSYKRFREVLVSAFPLGMKDQKDLLEKTFDDWCEGTEQVDDVTIMGIKIN